MQLLLFLLVFLAACTARKTSFTNPLLPAGADPWSIYKDGYYYYTHTTGSKLVIWKTKNIADLKKAEHKTVFDPPDSLPYSKQLWAPEIHYFNNSWYLYFAADDGRNEHHRLYELENRAADPLEGEWKLKCRLADPSNKWAIDGSPFEFKGRLYLVWSGWEGDVNGEQDIYISRMSDPWTLEGKRVRLSAPVYDWERHGDLHDPDNPPKVYVNEGPQFLSHGNKIFIVYSASGCWTENYALGMLSATDTIDLLDSASWTKSAVPVFAAAPQNGVYAPGHNSFVRSPDSTEDWILYHANAAPGQGCGGHRSPRAQKFTWSSNGMPEFGIPVRTGTPLPVPSNRKKIKRKN
jgi:GH43 family beta-xylosidase